MRFSAIFAFVLFAVSAVFSAGFVSLVSPSDGAQLSTLNSFTFNFADTSLGGGASVSCSLYIDGSSTPAATANAGNYESTIVSYSAPSGTHTWKVSCGNASSSNFIYTLGSGGGVVDTGGYDTAAGSTTPKVTINSPSNGASVSAPFTVTYSFTGPSAGICTPMVGSNSLSAQTVPSGSTSSFNSGSLSAGTYTISVLCNYDAGNGIMNSAPLASISVNVLGAGAPAILLEYPSNGETVDSGDVSFAFSYMPNGASKTPFCTLFVDGVELKSTQVAPETSTLAQVTGIPGGLHYWNVTCLADETLVVSQKYSFTVPQTEPYVILESPADNSVLSSGTVSLIFSFIPNGVNFAGQTLTCNVYLNGNQVGSRQIDGKFPSSASVSVDGLANGKYNWTVKCGTSESPEAYGSQKDSTFTVGVKTGPHVQLIMPENAALLLDGNVQFAFTYVANGGLAVMPCTAYLDGKALFSSGASSETGVIKTFPVADGEHSWYVTCGTDAESAYGSLVSQTNKFTVSTKGSKVLSLVSPPKDYRSAASPTKFVFNYSVQSDIPAICQLFINGNMTSMLENVAPGISSFNTSPFPASASPYFWQVICNDEISEVWSFNVLLSTPGTGGTGGSGGSSGGSGGGSGGTGGGAISPRPITKTTVSKNVTQTLPPKQNETAVPKPPTVQYATIYAPAEAYVNSSVQVALMTSAGRPIASATVFVVKPDGTRDPIITDSRGRLTFNPLFAGTYTYFASGYTMTGSAQTVVKEAAGAVAPKTDFLSQYGDYILIFVGVVIVLAVLAGAYAMLTKKPEEPQ